MKLTLKQLFLHALFLLLIISCFQAILFLFPTDDYSTFCPVRLLAVFIMCSIALVHNLLFNRYLKKKKQWGIYLGSTSVLLLFSWLLLALLSPFDYSDGNFSTALLPSLGIVIFFILAGLALNAIYLLLSEKSTYLENQVIMKQLELDYLKNQLNPHFLFNSLNNVAATIQVDTELALNYIYTLSSLLRYQVESSGKESVSLAEENFFIESFLGIEEVRLGDRCELSFDTELSNPGENIPPMLLQPFVERAIKQGSCLSQKSVVKINLRENDKELFLLTKSLIPLKPVNGQDSEIMFENAKRRLQLFYPSSHRIISERVNGYYETSLFIDLTSFKRIN